MKKLNSQLDRIQSSGKPGFMMHMVAGYPDLKRSEKIATQILESGAALLEVQIPFSDPVADGPVIARANELALKNGVTVEGSLLVIERIAASTEKPILIMTYFNIIQNYGVEQFCKRAAEIGVQGLIVPDYPYDEEQDNSLIKYSHENDLALIQVIASTSRADRINEIVKHASGFIYCMARTGITGRKTDINLQTIKYLESVRASSDLPMAVGFGLSERSQVQELKNYAQIMVVGSALIKEYADIPIDKGLQQIKKFMIGLIDV
ncbi:MAG: tryptophan synthase subunit alpha [Candidatus Marinimicrobia bacterium]|nr:tryptophan synthase subunit alpha [Candidatus Neomarinimicrobiota bacterium]